MDDRRTKRSSEPTLALQYLVEALIDRSEARAVALVDASGRIVAGVGAPDELRDLASLGGDARAAREHPRFEEVTAGTDWFACEVRTASLSLWLVALGERMRKLYDAACAAARILEGQPMLG